MSFSPPVGTHGQMRSVRCGPIGTGRVGRGRRLRLVAAGGVLLGPSHERDVVGPQWRSNEANVSHTLAHEVDAAGPCRRRRSTGSGPTDFFACEKTASTRKAGPRSETADAFGGGVGRTRGDQAGGQAQAVRIGDVDCPCMCPGRAQPLRDSRSAYLQTWQPSTGRAETHAVGQPAPDPAFVRR